MATNRVFLQIPGIIGTSRDPTHYHWINIESYSLGPRRSTGFGPGGGGITNPAAGTTSATLSKFTDLTTPLLANAVSSGTMYDFATLEVISGEGKMTSGPALKVRFADVVFTSLQTSGGREGAIESLTINFTNMTSTY